MFGIAMMFRFSRKRGTEHLTACHSAGESWALRLGLEGQDCGEALNLTRCVRLWIVLEFSILAATELPSTC